MNNTHAKYQRNRLEDALRRYPAQKNFEIPSCSPAEPCLDGRCPVCGMRCTMAINELLSTPESRAFKWTRAAYVLDNLCSSIGTADQFDFTKVSVAMGTLKSVIAGAGGTFIGMFGLMLDDQLLLGRLAKVPVIEFSYALPETEHWVPEAETLAPYILKRLGFKKRNRNPLPSDARHPIQLGYPLYRGGPFIEDILVGYVRRDITKPVGSEAIMKKKLLAEFASNYGQHSITDRLVTCGVIHKDDALAFQQSCPWSIGTGSLLATLGNVATGGRDAHV